jgi:hypothetical protein
VESKWCVQSLEKFKAETSKIRAIVLILEFTVSGRIYKGTLGEPRRQNRMCEGRLIFRCIERGLGGDWHHKRCATLGWRGNGVLYYTDPKFLAREEFHFVFTVNKAYAEEAEMQLRKQGIFQALLLS